MPDALKKEIEALRPGKLPVQKTMLTLLMGRGYRDHLDEPNVVARAYAFERLMTAHRKHVYQNDLIVGSLRGLAAGPDDDLADLDMAHRLCESFGSRDFLTNADHFAPDYDTLVRRGVGGLMADVRASAATHAGEAPKQDFLRACGIALNAFSSMIAGYADAARAAGNREAAASLDAIRLHRPATFRDGLQLVYLCHLAFEYEGRGAMALGRLDQYLYPLYRQDVKAGRLNEQGAQKLLANMFIKFSESQWFGGDEVINIAIGGVLPDTGADATNSLSRAILRAVGQCQIPGPNLSARIHRDTPDVFLDECLQVIGTGLGYPALMNDEVNIPALLRYGYALEDCRDYCMVGCIENFLQGRQPPWSDGRFNTPKYLELALNGGRDLRTGEPLGPQTPMAFSGMDAFLDAFEKQLAYGVSEYMALAANRNARLNARRYQSPLLSCLCRDCVARGLDVNEGGALYPSAHGACLMGIGTVTDSLCALEMGVFGPNPVCSQDELREALQTGFEGREALRQKLLALPKYGNDDPRADQYAVWFLETLHRLFSGRRMPDGGAVYLAMAANIQNISAGRRVAATPDGRLAGAPISDAASPTYGRDLNGPTAVGVSTTKLDYTLAACGTVLNQRFSPDVFRDADKRKRLAALIRVYFERGGQEMQVNAVSRETLRSARENPEAYRGLVVRVSGFSAYYVTLDPAVQEDILARTEHG